MQRKNIRIDKISGGEYFKNCLLYTPYENVDTQPDMLSLTLYIVEYRLCMIQD